ncbi:MAG: hypothetical protein ACYSWU_14535, partial [Planctomycetota bacterium]
MPPSQQDREQIERLRRLMQGATAPAAAPMQPAQPTPQQVEDQKRAAIHEAQRIVASSSADLEALQDEDFQAHREGRTLIPEFEQPPGGSGRFVDRPILKRQRPAKGGSALERYNEIRAKYGLGPAENVPEEVGAGEQIAESVDVENLPLAGGFVTAKKLWDVRDAAKAIEDKKATVEDWQTVAAYMQEAVQDSRERTFGGGVARIATESLPFWVDFFASGGVPALLKKGGKEVGKKAVAKSISAAAKKSALGAIRTLGTSSLRLPVFSHRVAANQVRRTLPEFAAYFPEGDEDAEFVVLEEGEEGLKAFKNAVADTYIEIVSEQTGHVVGAIGGKLRKAVGLAPARIPARAFLQKFGIHSATGELAEERIGQAMREAATRIGAVELPQQVPTAEQMAQEFVAFMLPGGAARAVQGASRALVKAPAEDMAPRARAFIDLHPEEAQRIAALEGKVSRKQLKDAAGDTLTHEEVATLPRGPFRDLVRDAFVELENETPEQRLERLQMAHQVEVPRGEIPPDLARGDVAQQPPVGQVLPPVDKVVEVSEIPEFKRKGRNPVSAFIRRLFMPSGVMPVTAFNRWRERNQWYKARLKEIDHLRIDFDKGAAEIYGSVRQMDEQSRLAVNEVLGGKGDV